MLMMMMRTQVSDEFVCESSSVVSHLLSENNLMVFADLICTAVKMLRACKYSTLCCHFRFFCNAAMEFVVNISGYY